MGPFLPLRSGKLSRGLANPDFLTILDARSAANAAGVHLDERISLHLGCVSDGSDYKNEAYRTNMGSVGPE